MGLVVGGVTAEEFLAGLLGRSIMNINRSNECKLNKNSCACGMKAICNGSIR